MFSTQYRYWRLGLLHAPKKLGKPKRPVTNVRPITPLPTKWKKSSNIVLTRIRDKDKYHSQPQIACRNIRSTDGIIWTYRWIAKTQI